MMIHEVLGNPNHPEYGVATIPFPIPHDQYAHCMDLLETLEIGRIQRRRYCAHTVYRRNPHSLHAGQGMDI